MQPDLTFRVADFISRSIVYGWKSKGVYLYIGQSKKGLQRISQHDSLIRKEESDPRDIIEVWYTTDPDKLERELIKLYQPKYNTTHRGTNRVCPECSKEFYIRLKSERTHCIECYKKNNFKFDFKYKDYLKGNGIRLV